MNSRALRLTLILLIASVASLTAYAEKAEKKEEEKPAYVFETDYQVKRTPPKNQYKTGTCWCFSTISFLESEFLRLTGEEIDLSEMFVARHVYPQKALYYVRMHGKAPFSQGALSHNAIDAVRRYGIVPESVYPGKCIGEKRHNHGEMFAVLKAVLDAVLKRSGKRFTGNDAKLTPKWPEAFETVLDVYLGKPPETFSYKGGKYTPKSFLNDYLKINLNDYIELTSYTHHPFYQGCNLEIPDNAWGRYNDSYYNVPIDDIERIVEHSLKNGFSVVWDGDISEHEYSGKRGYGIIPEKDWEDKTEKERDEEITEPVKEKQITQEDRQAAFNSFSTTDDHLMHIVGIAHDQNGTKFYLTKDSSNKSAQGKYNGYVYLSSSYFRLKTIALMVNKNALPDDIAEKLNLKN